ncbi:hypothetical protein [Reticulibacter mediterranei]|uniref:hypothetical protein n=1 Tax=Reticulibacter mediterranei TaxID=2778369 RepID=UPI001C691FED|nr:hypothetical protein [Reticulibacter mediterranei]
MTDDLPPSHSSLHDALEQQEGTEPSLLITGPLSDAGRAVRLRRRLIGSVSLTAGLILLLAFFLSWLGASTSCERGSCAGAFPLFPASASGFDIAGPGITSSMEICLHEQAQLICYPKSLVETFQVQLLWGMLVVSVALLVLPLLMRLGARVARHACRRIIGSFWLALFIEVIYLPQCIRS